MELRHLKKDTFYIFDHKSKGRFVAKFLEIYDQPEDLVDPQMVKVAVYTGPGSSQERLANSMVYAGNRKLTPLFSDKMLRPSQLNSINAPTTAEQARLQESVKNSEKEDYTPSNEYVATYSSPPSQVMESINAGIPLKRDYSKYIIGGVAAAAGAGAATGILLFIGG